MKNIISIVGILLIIFGIGTYSFKRYTYSTEENVAQIGDLKLTTQNEKSIYFPPILSGLSVVAGVILVVVGMGRKF